MRDGTEQLVLIAEGNSGDAPELRRQIHRAVTETFGLQPSHIGIVSVGALPKTSSGKAQRSKTKAMYEEGALTEHP
jgi:fatty-acyl-CoA synthase